MTEHTSALLRLLSERGYIHQTTDAAALDALANKQTVPGYIGFDPTAPSLHVGSLVQIMLLRRLQQSGHKPIVLMGGGTGKIGDPSFKDEARKLLDHDGIATNVASIRRIFERFLVFGDGPTDAIMLGNAEWLDRLEYIPFLRDVGQHFSVNRMLSFDSVKLRLDREQSLSFLEFNYMILQAYDFLELSRRAGCRLQMGGSDQWGNIVNGVELIRRKLKKEAYGLTTPLITLASGAKMGKTEKGAVWLNEDLFSSYEYWQFWRNTDDRDVKKFLNFFTEIKPEEVDRLINNEKNINKLKILLANETTKILHGNSASTKAEKTAKKTFESGGFGGELPEIKIKESILKQGINILDLLSSNKIMSSKSEARRAIKSKALKIDNEILLNENKLVQLSDFGEDNTLKVSFGKKKHYLIKII